MHSDITLRIEPDHPALAGHFPGRPIVPGVVLLDAAVHAITQMLGPPIAPVQVTSAKFLSPVTPGETVTISLDTEAAGAARFEMSSGGRKVAIGTLVLRPAS